MNNIIECLESKGLEVYFDEMSFERFGLEKYDIGRGYEPEFINLMNSHPMSYNTHHIKTKDIKSIKLINDEIIISVETLIGKCDRRFGTFYFDLAPLIREGKQ